MKNLLIVVLAFFSLSAGAVGIGNDNPPGVGGDIRNTNTNINGANADSRARAQSYAAALNRSEQTVNVSTSPVPQPVTVNYNQASTPAVTRQEVHQDAINVRSVPNVFAGNVYPTAPCMGSSTVGAAALGWGASIGTSWADDECGIRETARSFQNLGMNMDAVVVLCSSKYAAVAPVCKAQSPAQPK